MCPGIGAFYFRGRMAPDHHQRRGEGQLQREFLPGTLRSCWEGLVHLQPFREVIDRLDVGRALDGTLTGPLPVWNSLRHHACCRVVMRQPFGLEGGDRRKPLLDHP